MGIQIKKLYNVESFSIKNIENVSEDLILINIELKAVSLSLDSRPFHYRYDYGDFPPLDISFDSETGLIKEITIFINKVSTRYEYQGEDANLISIEGYPCANINFLVKHEYYYDEVCDMKLSYFDSALRVIQSGRVIHKKLVVNDDLNILLDDEDIITGLVINNLSAENSSLFK